MGIDDYVEIRVHRVDEIFTIQVARDTSIDNPEGQLSHDGAGRQVTPQLQVDATLASADVTIFAKGPAVGITTFVETTLVGDFGESDES